MWYLTLNLMAITLLNALCQHEALDLFFYVHFLRQLGGAASKLVNNNYHFTSYILYRPTLIINSLNMRDDLLQWSYIADTYNVQLAYREYTNFISRVVYQLECPLGFRFNPYYHKKQK